MDPDDAYGLLIRGKELLARGHAHQAAVVLERAVLCEPDKTSIREALARALYNSGHTARAREQFATVLELDPANDYCHFAIGLCHAKSGNLEVARGHLKMAVVMRPESSLYRETLERLAG